MAPKRLCLLLSSATVYPAQTPSSWRDRRAQQGFLTFSPTKTPTAVCSASRTVETTLTNSASTCTRQRRLCWSGVAASTVHTRAIYPLRLVGIHITSRPGNCVLRCNEVVGQYGEGSVEMDSVR